MARFGEKELGAHELNRLIATTKQYLQKRSLKPNLISDSIEEYIQNLLPRELEAARKIDENRLPKESQKADILVLLVGFSFEPLLQSVCAYKPREVLLVLNDIYTEDINGQMVGGWISKLIQKLPDDLLPEKPQKIGALEINESTGEEQFITQPARPDKVFQFLIDQLLRKPNGNEKGRIVIDITGAKKSMVTGAYLFGALTDCALSYVDFEVYDPEHSSPYGYSCNIGEISNPYRSFQIANWRRVQERYEHYALGEAAKLLDEIIAELVREGMFMQEEKKDETGEVDAQKQEPEELVRLKKLREVITLYASWDAGDIPQAYGKWKSEIEAIRIVTPPMVMEKLGPAWQEAEANATTVAQTGAFAQAHWAKDKWAEILGTNHWQVMLVYVQDELAKIQRILKLQGDARAAFIRAANLHEYTLKMRLLILVHINDGFRLISGSVNALFGVAFFKASQAILFSVNPANSKFLQKFNENSNVRIELKGNISTLKLKMFDGWDALLGTETERRLVDRFREVRNSALHSLSVIPQEDATSAVEFIEKDWDNLLDPWAKLLLSDFSGQINLSEFKDAKTLRANLIGDTKFGLPFWKDLLGKEMCNIDFLPIFDEKAKPIQEPKS